MPRKDSASPDVRRIAAEINIVSDKNDPPETTFECLRECYAIAVGAYDEIYRVLLVSIERIDRAQVTIEEMVDCAFAVRETNARLQNLVKELNAMEKRIAQAVSIQWVLDPDATDKIQGQFCNGFPSVKTGLKSTPSFETDPDKYNALCDYFGIPEDLRDRGKMLTAEGEFETEVLKFNYNGLCDWITRATLHGHQLPPGIEMKDTFRQAKLKVVRKHDLLPPIQPTAK